MADTTIKLSRRYEAHGATFDAITLREPTGADYWHLGAIAEWQPAGEGMALITYHEKVRAYAERLVTAPAGVAVATLAVLDLADTLKVDRAVRDFFQAANSSNAPPTS